MCVSAAGTRDLPEAASVCTIQKASEIYSSLCAGASTALMFVAMVMCLPIAWIARLVETHKKRKSSDEQKPLLGKGNGGESCSLHVLSMHL